MNLMLHWLPHNGSSYLLQQRKSPTINMLEEFMAVMKKKLPELGKTFQEQVKLPDSS